MSTFLQLCVDLRREGGMTGSGPTATTSQVGEYLRIVEWIASAYEKIQNLHPNWDFLRNDFSFATVASTGNYTKSAASVSELGTWKTDTFRCYLTATGVSDQQDIDYVPWADFRESYSLGSLSTQEGRPILFTVKPDQSVTFWPIPNAIYTVTGEYFKRAQTLAADASEPLIPLAFQDVIVYRALMFYGAYAGADEKYAHGEREYKQVLARLELNQLPEMEMAGPLA